MRSSFILGMFMVTFFFGMVGFALAGFLHGHDDIDIEELELAYPVECIDGTILVQTWDKGRTSVQLAGTGLVCGRDWHLGERVTAEE